MTTPQKLMMQSIVKFGAVTVFACIFYIESVRPQIQQNIITQQSITEANLINARSLQRMSEVQVTNAATSQRSVVAIEKIQKVLERQREHERLSTKHVEDDEVIE